MNWMSVRRPIQYMGNELNLRFNAPDGKRLRVCMCFPENYDVGMSCLGYRIVHDIYAAHPDVSCERAFLPMDDMLHVLTAENKIPFSVETQTPLTDFDVLAICVNCEINQVNAVRLLTLCGIPVKASERNETHPYIVIGGLNNPEPIAEMCDAIFLGEFEDVAAESIAAMVKTKGLSHAECSDALAKIPGLYIPSRFPEPVTRVCAPSFATDYMPKQWVLPYTQTVFDRMQVEIQRGCPNQCTFCQARCVYHPYRERSPQLIMKAVDAYYRQTGYEDLSLLGLSVVDYSEIDTLLDELIPYCQKRKISLSVPSIRPTAKALDVMERLAFGGKRPSMTLAMEAADDDLRRSFGKVIRNDDVKTMVLEGARRGYRTFKFYYLTGFPGEDDGHIDRIADFVESCAAAVREEKGFWPQMNVSVNCLMPKPFSVLENAPLLDETRYIARINRLKERFFKRKNHMVTFLDYGQVIIESLLSRGDRSMFAAISEVAAVMGNDAGRLYDRSLWLECCAKTGVNVDRITCSADSLPRHIVTSRGEFLNRLKEKNG